MNLPGKRIKKNGKEAFNVVRLSLEKQQQKNAGSLNVWRDWTRKGVVSRILVIIGPIYEKNWNDDSDDVTPRERLYQ